MMRRRRWGCIIAASLLVALGFGRTDGAAGERYEMRSAVSPRASAAEFLRRADRRESLRMSVTLQLRHREELDALIAAQQSPGAPEYHRWLSPEQFTARFAPAPQSYAALVNWLERAGFAVHPSPSFLRIDFGGTVAQVERAFAVRMNHYRHHGRSALANENAPVLPSEFSDTLAVVRLNTFALADPLVRVVDANGVVNAMAPRDMYTAYDMQPLLARGVDGTGQTIAVVARSDFSDADVENFQRQFSLPVRPPQKVFPGSNPGIGSAQGVCQGITNPHERESCIAGEHGEVRLDVEWARAMAPGASVLVDIADTDIDGSLLDIVNHHAEAKTITMSFGSCERLDGSSLQLFEPMYAQAAVQGQTVLVATGDDGADGCRDGAGPSVNALASDPNVTAVGGTALDPGFDTRGNATRYVREAVWQDVGASGGGLSTLVRQPAYQTVPGAPMDGFRGQPDVSLMASPAAAGYVVIFDGRIGVVGGTSAAAPSWAGIVALLNHAAGVVGSGALNPMLYALGRKQYAQGGPTVFHDVAAGDNRFNGVAGFAAGPEFDLATGLGTPDVDLLAQAIAASACIGDCDRDGTVTVDELLTGVTIALGEAAVSECLPLDANADGEITIDELITATNRALDGCWPG